MTIKNVCFILGFLFYVLEAIENKNATRCLVCAIPLVFVVLQLFANPFLPVVFYGQAKRNQKAAAEFEQKKHEEAAEWHE